MNEKKKTNEQFDLAKNAIDKLADKLDIANLYELQSYLETKVNEVEEEIDEEDEEEEEDEFDEDDEDDEDEEL